MWLPTILTRGSSDVWSELLLSLMPQYWLFPTAFGSQIHNCWVGSFGGIGKPMKLIRRCGRLCHEMVGVASGHKDVLQSLQVVNEGTHLARASPSKLSSQLTFSIQKEKDLHAKKRIFMLTVNGDNNSIWSKTFAESINTELLVTVRDSAFSINSESQNETRLELRPSKSPVTLQTGLFSI